MKTESVPLAWRTRLHGFFHIHWVALHTFTPQPFNKQDVYQGIPYAAEAVGGLKTYLVSTTIVFFVGYAAIIGIPFLSGWWSKDAILGAVHDKIHAGDHAAVEDAAGASFTGPP